LRGASVRAGVDDQYNVACVALKAGRQHFDLLLSDIDMPRKGGYDFIRDVRRSGHRLPAAALTAFARSGTARAPLLYGYQAHVTKSKSPRSYSQPSCR